MYPDEDLLQEAEKALRRLKFKRRDILRDQIDGYLEACQLSRGPLKDRNAHWEKRAAKMGADLAREAYLVNAYTDGE